MDTPISIPNSQRRTNRTPTPKPIRTPRPRPSPQMPRRRIHPRNIRHARTHIRPLWILPLIINHAPKKRHGTRRIQIRHRSRMRQRPRPIPIGGK